MACGTMWSMFIQPLVTPLEYCSLKFAVTHKVFITEGNVTVHDTSGTGGDATEDVTCANIDPVFLPNGQISSENGVI